MNREEFLTRLEGMLQNISPAEREEVLQYYRDYFEDAGSENEQSVIQALGDPADIAENIKKDLQGDDGSRATASDHAVMEYGSPEACERDKYYGSPTAGERGNYYDNPAAGADAGYREPAPAEKKRMPGWAIVLLTLLIVFASPVLIGLLGVLFGLLVTWFALIFSFGVATVALFAVLFVLIIVGAMCVTLDPVVGLALAGGGLICGGIGLLFLMLTVAMAGILTPGIFSGLGWLFWRRKKGKTV
ncbi:MAG: DUF1700 domain-containing protein [Acetatifactor sp.]